MIDSERDRGVYTCGARNGCKPGVSMSSVIIVFAAILSAALPACGFQGGTGEACDPYQIADAEDLLSIGSDAEFMSKSFVLVADIDLDPNSPECRIFDNAVISLEADKGAADLPDSVFRAVGRHEVSVFEGTFLGNGHVIRNMVIDAGDGKCVGLFEYLGEDAVVSDLRIENSRVKGKMHVGLLAGMNAGTVSYCAVSGSVSAESRGGGMVGTSRGAMTCCETETQVTGNRMLGGLVGHALAKSSITHSRVRSQVIGQSSVGGIVGQMLPGTLTGCFASGTVTSKTDAGGITGSGPFGGSILKCYSAVDVKGLTVGGLIGIAQRTSVTNSHAFGALAQLDSAAGEDENAALGGIVGHWRAGKGSIISSSWHTNMAPANAAIGRCAPNSTVNILATRGHAPHAGNTRGDRRYRMGDSRQNESNRLSVKRCANSNAENN